VTTARFDLTLSIEEEDGELRGTVEYATDLFDATTVDRLLGHWERLLAAAAATPDLPVSVLPLLSGAERGQILLEWNDTGTVPAPEVCLHELFADQARRTPGAVALVDGTREILYRELAEAAGRLAGLLRRSGVGPEVVVGVCLERSVDLVTSLLAVLQAGAAYLPLDPRLPPARLAALLTGARASPGTGRCCWWTKKVIGLRLRKRPASAPRTSPTCSSPPARRESPKGSPSPTAARWRWCAGPPPPTRRRSWRASSPPRR
jgi:non-ribosomal peptide synthetase component F